MLRISGDETGRAACGGASIWLSLKGGRFDDRL
jgi:hypothetical protein